MQRASECPRVGSCRSPSGCTPALRASACTGPGTDPCQGAPGAVSVSCTPHRRRQGYCARGSAGSLGGSPAVSRIESGRAASGGSSPSRSRRPLRHGRSVPAVVVQPPPPRPSRCRTTVEGVVQWSVRFAPSNVSTGSGAQVLSFRWTIRKSASFRTGYPRLAAALSVPLQNGLRFLRDLLPPAPSPFLAVRIPPRGGVRGAYPVA